MQTAAMKAVGINAARAIGGKLRVADEGQMPGAWSAARVPIQSFTFARLNASLEKRRRPPAFPPSSNSQEGAFILEVAAWDRGPCRGAVPRTLLRSANETVIKIP